MTRVKACGITNLADARFAADLGAWAVGLIFWPGSPRSCDLAAAEEIGADLHRRTEVVGVFVNATLDYVAEVADRVGLTLLQLHGDEGPVYCGEAGRRTGARTMKAMAVKDALSVGRVRAFHSDFHMLDAHVEGMRGGTGEVFSWELAKGHPGDPPVVLSGGLTPDNVAQAIEAVRPFAVDSASGTEREPGRKDHDRMRAFFAAAGVEQPQVAR